MFSREQCNRRLAKVYEQLDRQSRREAGDEQHSVWDSLLARLQTEWELLAAKTHALLAAAEGQSDRKRVKSDQTT